MTRRKPDRSALDAGQGAVSPFRLLEALADAPWEWPEGAGELILSVLQDPAAPVDDRVLAATFGGEYSVVNDALVEALLAIVQSGSEPVELRAQAAISLGPALEAADEVVGFEEDLSFAPIAEETFNKIRKLLRAVYLDAGVPEEVRRRALEAAVRAPQDWQQAAVRAAWASGDPDWRLTAAFCMAYVKGFDQSIMEALHSGNPDLRYQAVIAAGNWGLKSAWKDIAPLVGADNDDKPLRIAAIEAVANIKPRKAHELLVDLLDSDEEDEEIVEAVEEALVMSGLDADLD